VGSARQKASRSARRKSTRLTRGTRTGRTTPARVQTLNVLRLTPQKRAASARLSRKGICGDASTLPWYDGAR